jgi:hypothetical protein
MGLTSLLFIDETTTTLSTTLSSSSSSSNKSENTNNEKQLNGGLIGLISLLNQLTSILKHPKTPPSTRQSILSFVNELLFEEINMRTSSSSSNPPSTDNSKSIPSHSFYPHILPFIEFTETIKKDYSYGLNVVKEAATLIFLSSSFFTKDYISKYSTYKTKEESIKILINIFLSFFLAFPFKLVTNPNTSKYSVSGNVISVNVDEYMTFYLDYPITEVY